MKEPLVSRILKYALYAVFAAGVVITATLPLMFTTYTYIFFGNVSLREEYIAFIVPFLMSIGVPCLWIVLEMIWMLRSIPKGPFVIRNVHALYRIGILFLVLAAAFAAKCFIFLTFLTLFSAFLFTGGGLFAFTLAALIRQSIVFREENDLTI